MAVSHEDWLERAEARFALRRAGLSEVHRVPPFDVIAAEVAAAAGVADAAVVVVDGVRRWCPGATWASGREWAGLPAPPGWARIAGVAIHGPGTPRWPVGELALFAPPDTPTTSDAAIVERFGRVTEALVAERARATEVASALGVALVDANARILGVSRSLEDVLGWSIAERAGTSGLDLIHHDDWGLAAETFGRTTASSGRRPPLELRLTRADGSFRPVEVRSDNRLDDASIGAVVLELSEPSAGRGVIVADRPRQIIRLVAREVSAPAVAAACAALVEGEVGGRCRVLICDEDDTLEHLAGSIADQEPVATGDAPIAHEPRGSAPPALALATQQPVIVGEWDDGVPWWAFPITGGADEQVLGVLDVRPDRSRLPSPDDRQIVASATDLCAIALAQQRSETRTRQQLARDEATGLPNRAMLALRLDDPAQEPIAALIVCHLGALDLLRRTYGHETAGDLLSVIADRVRSVLRTGDLAFRSADDELAIALTGRADARAAVAVARKVANRCTEAIPLDGRDIFVEIVCGIALADDVSASRLLADAELAAHRARTGGRPVEVYRDDMLQTVLQTFKLEAELRHALRAEEFVLHYQPKVDLSTGEVVGVEALLRWSHPQRGLVPPGEILPTLEHSGLIVPVGRLVLELACRQVAAWAAQGIELDVLQVNASPLQLDVPDFADAVLEACSPDALEPTRLVLEITESVLGEQHEQARQAVLELAKAGVEFAIDDFGTGYSSLVRLQQFPITEIKIDRSFVAQITDDSLSPPPLLTSVLAMADAIGATTVAEGVETRRQARLLSELGCRFGQGFYFARPAPSHTLPDTIANATRDW